MNVQSETLFKALDVVIVLGDPNLHPWQAAARQLYYFVKQCIRHSKPCFLSGCGLHALAFLCSMGADRPMIGLMSRQAGSGPPDREADALLGEGEMYLDS